MSRSSDLDAPCDLTRMLASAEIAGGRLSGANDSDVIITSEETHRILINPSEQSLVASGQTNIAML